MSFYLSTEFHRLPEEELGRIQRLLGLILRNQGKGDRIRDTIKVLYKNRGVGEECLAETTLRGETFTKLLDHFGYLDGGRMSDAERDALRENPCTVWPGAETCMVPGEAFEVLLQESLPRNREYLLFHMSRLSPREKKAWWRWLDLPDVPLSGIRRTLALYTRIASLRSRSSQPDVQKGDIPRFLDELFSDSPPHTPLSWFYREVLPFYSALMEMERTGKGADTRQQRNALRLFKEGYLVVRPVEPAFGEAVRYEIIRTRESADVGPPPFDFAGEISGREWENRLF